MRNLFRPPWRRAPASRSGGGQDRGESHAARRELRRARRRRRARAGRRATMPALAREGFSRNPVVYRCVRLVAEAASSVPWLLYEGARELDRASAARPSRRGRTRAQRAPSFIEALYGHLLLAGNAYVEAVALGRRGRASFTRCGPIACGRAGRRRLGGGLRLHRRRAHAGASPPSRRRSRDPAPDALSSARRSSTASRRSRRRDGARPVTTRPRLEQGAARQCGAALGRARLPAGRGREPQRQAV